MFSMHRNALRRSLLSCLHYVESIQFAWPVRGSRLTAAAESRRAREVTESSFSSTKTKASRQSPLGVGGGVVAEAKLGV